MICSGGPLQAAPSDGLVASGQPLPSYHAQHLSEAMLTLCSYRRQSHPWSSPTTRKQSVLPASGRLSS